MDSEITSREKDGVSLYVAIGIMVSLAAASVIITFTLFINSSAYKTVKEIQANSRVSSPGLTDYDTTSPVKFADIDETSKGIENKIDGLDNQADYGPDAVSDSALGSQR